jgi:Cu+-exporting ATPase
MKNTVQLLIVLLILATSCNTTTKPEVKTISTEKTTTISSDAVLTKAEFGVEGMTCQMGCASAIEKKLNAVSGVQSAKVDFSNKKASVSFDSSLTNPEALTAAITSAGKSYSVTTVNLVEEFTVKSCKKECTKPCCAKDKAACKKECTKPCCSKDKTACQKDCKKACCTKKEEAA